VKPRAFIDQLGRKLVLNDKPRRIVSLVPSQTELLYDLGMDESVLGITKFCIHPTDWFESKVRVGGTKNVNIERVKALNPDLILANKEENTKEDIALLEEIAPVWISDINSFEDALNMIRSVGELLGIEVLAAKQITEITSAFSSASIHSRISALYFIWKDPDYCAGKGTFISSMMEKAGFVNVCESRRYPEVGTFNMPQPEYILLSTEPYPFKEKDRDEYTNRYPNAKVILVDGEMFSWYGSRMRLAATYFKELQHQIGRH
jgi:ABC-type Fe3+-hydroxamate transport system substrate-binding protein